MRNLDPTIDTNFRPGDRVYLKSLGDLGEEHELADQYATVTKVIDSGFADTVEADKWNFDGNDNIPLLLDEDVVIRAFVPSELEADLSEFPVEGDYVFARHESNSPGGFYGWITGSFRGILTGMRLYHIRREDDGNVDLAFIHNIQPVDRRYWPTHGTYNSAAVEVDTTEGTDTPEPHPESTDVDIAPEGPRVVTESSIPVSVITHDDKPKEPTEPRDDQPTNDQKTAWIRSWYRSAYDERSMEHHAASVASYMLVDDQSVDLRGLGELSHETARRNGFWDYANVGEKVSLIHAEVSELLEELRLHENFAADASDDEKRQAELEAADIIIRLMDLMHHLGLDEVTKALAVKMTRNLGRTYKHGKGF